jgi:hypothetical protein
MLEKTLYNKERMEQADISSQRVEASTTLRARRWRFISHRYFTQAFARALALGALKPAMAPRGRT